MKNLYKELIESAPVKARLQFGFNENVILDKVDFSVRKNKGMPINANTFINLVQVDPETRKAKASFEGSFWNLDPKSDFCETNFYEQLTTLQSLSEAVGISAEDYTEKFLELLAIDEDVEIDDHIKTKDGSAAATKAMQDALEWAIDGKTGENSPLLKCKLVVNKKGYLEFPGEMDWILPMDSDEELPALSARQKKMYEASLNQSDKPKTSAPDEPGDAPEEGEASVASGGGLPGL